MKKWFLLIFIFAFVFFNVNMVYAENNIDNTTSIPDIRIKSILLSKSVVVLKKGESITLKTSVMPTNATEKMVWETTNNKIVTVDNGKLIAKDIGNATITVYNESKTTFTKCNVTVIEDKKIDENAPRIILDNRAISLKIGESMTLHATLSTTNSSDNLVWKSSNDNITVKNGVVTANKKGSAIITVSTKDEKVKTTCSVIINDKDELKDKKYKAVEKIVLSKNSITLYKGNVQILGFSILPNDADDKRIIWTSSDDTVATVEDGKVIAHKRGTAVITISNIEKSVKETCEVNVIDAVDEDDEKKDAIDVIIVVAGLGVMIILIIILFIGINKQKK